MLVDIKTLNNLFKVGLKEVFERALGEGWIVIASNIYTLEYATGIARAMYETKSPGIIQASSDTLPHIADIYSRIVKKDPPGVNDLLRGAARLSEQRHAIIEELEEKGNPDSLSLYLAIDHSDPLNKIFIGTKEDLAEYHDLMRGKPQDRYFEGLVESISSFAKNEPEEFAKTFVLPKANKPLSKDEAIYAIAKYLLFTEKVIMGERVKGASINIDIDYIALDLSLPLPLNIALTKAVTVTRDYYASSGKYVLIESGFGIEQEKEALNPAEQKEYAKKVLDYVDRTNIDAISCNIGTYHGEMVKGEKGTSSLHLTLMETVRDGLKKMEEPNVIIVAHGGSSISDECLKELDIPRLGLVKINKASVYIGRYVKEIKDYVESPKVFKDGKFDRGASKGFNIYNPGINGVMEESKRLFEFAGSAGKVA
jgi:fructose/tagatose bisphosphate aldolase